MNSKTILIAGNSPALSFAAQSLQDDYMLQSQASLSTQYVLLDIPSFHGDGSLRSGQSIDTLLAAMPEDVIICGGNLTHEKLRSYCKIDFLKDETYLCENAAITSDCAIKVARQHLISTLNDTPVLVIGWGRIGKCLSRLLKNMGCKISVAARSEKDRAILNAMGYPAIRISEIIPSRFRLIYNTVPEEILDTSACVYCVKIDLASRKGLIGNDVIWARGLPGMYAPETSGKLIAATFRRLIQEV